MAILSDGTTVRRAWCDPFVVRRIEKIFFQKISAQFHFSIFKNHFYFNKLRNSCTKVGHNLRHTTRVTVGASRTQANRQKLVVTNIISLPASFLLSIRWATFWISAICYQGRSTFWCGWRRTSLALGTLRIGAVTARSYRRLPSPKCITCDEIPKSVGGKANELQHGFERRTHHFD